MKLSDYLKVRGLRPSTLARQAGVPCASITLFLSGKRGLSLATAAKIVKATRGIVRYDDLLQHRDRYKPDGERDNDG